MSTNEENFPAGSRVQINKNYGITHNGPTDKSFTRYHGIPATVIPYYDVNGPYVQVKYDNPPEDMETMLMLPSELDKI